MALVFKKKMVFYLIIYDILFQKHPHHVFAALPPCEKTTTKHPRSYMENKSEWNVMVKQKISSE